MISGYKPIGDGYRYGYWMAGTGRAGTCKRTLLDKFRLWRRRRHADDLTWVKRL